MAVQVAPRKGGKSSLIIDHSDKQDKVNKVRENLDDAFGERDVMYQASQMGFEYINLYGKPIDTADLAILKKEDTVKYGLGVFKANGKDLHIATMYPNENQLELLDVLKKKGYTFKMYLCSQKSFDKLVNLYTQVVMIKNTDDDLSISSDVLSKFADEGISLDSLEQNLRGVPTSDFVNIVLISALENKASDIHFEPEKDKYELRLRLDGVLYTYGEFDKTVQRKVESRLKILSDLKLNVDNVPQDGRFSFSYDGRDIDVRVSMLPSNYGYSIVMRLLGTGNVDLDLEALGFYSDNRAKVEKALSKHQGMVLATGPTGSGKTTTLYTFLNMLNDGSNKIITLEDPVEYKLEGVSQTQIDEEDGYTFAGGLRSILRQDPDVVMVGEVRDEETASVSVQAALTGHKVLSTLHTNDAVGAVSRLMEMDVEGYMIADSVEAIIGQRLLRRICQDCKEECVLNEEEQKLVDENLDTLPVSKRLRLPREKTWYKSKGCEVCNGKGYKGRLGVYEILTMTDGVRELIGQERPSFVEMRKKAKDEGMVTMRQDAVLKALAGFTDIKEIIRAVD